MMFSFSQKSLDRMNGVDQRLVEVFQRGIKITKIDFGIPEQGGKRTADEQNDLFTRELSKADGYVSKSKHQDGKALDFYAYVDGKASWDVGHLAQVACALYQAAMDLGHKITWGGTWSNFVDSPHIQIED